MIGTFNGLLFSFLLLKRGLAEEKLSDKLLAFLLLSLCLIISDYTLGYMGIEIFWGDGMLAYFPHDAGFVVGPIVYFYLISLTNPSFKFEKSHLIHFAPQLAYYLYRLIIYFQGSPFVDQWQEQVDGVWHLDIILEWLKYISQYFYVFLSFKVFHEYSGWINNQFSETEPISLKWYKNFLVVFIITITLQWINSIQLIVTDFDFNSVGWFYYFLAVLIVYLGIFGYNQKAFLPITQVEETQSFDIPFGTATPLTPLNLDSDKTVKVDSLELENWKCKVNELFVSKRSYLKSDLTLNDLATQLSTNPSQLSYVINEGFGKNFNDFVNQQRVELVKQKLKSKEHLRKTLLGIAHECGFNSKATFNRAFKKFTEMTPKDFIESQQLSTVVR
jgi:AraC-like DNA-binding protein